MHVLGGAVLEISRPWKKKGPRAHGLAMDF